MRLIKGAKRTHSFSMEIYTPPPAGSISTWQGGMEESYSIEEFQGRLFRCHVSSALWRRMAALTLGRVRDVLVPRDSMKIGVAVAKGPTPKGIPRQGLEGAFVKTCRHANSESERVHACKHACAQSSNEASGCPLG